MTNLIKIKRLIISGKYAFTAKAIDEMDADGLIEEDVLESILNAQFARTKKSSSRFRQKVKEKVYIIESFTYSGILIYTKGVIHKEAGGEKLYFLISSKKSISS